MGGYVPLALPAADSVFGQAIPFSNLFILITVLAVLVVLLVIGLLAYSLLRTRRRPADGLPPQDFGNRRLEITWTAIPAAIVLTLFALTFLDMRTGATPGTNPPETQQPDVIAIGHQWWWEFRYPQAGFATANELHLPVGKQIVVHLTTADTQHGFWIPPLGQKMDIYPNKTNYLFLYAEEPGAYQGVCSEYCGTQHAWMRILAVAQPQADYDAWVQAQRAGAVPPPTRAAERGRQLFVERTCANCHALTGLSEARAAPDLTHFASRTTISSGVLPNTRENLTRYLADPQAVKPGVLMPNFRLSRDDLEALVAYLESLK